MKWLDALKMFAPLVLSFIPGMPASIVPAVVHGIAVAEGIPGADGATKKAAVLDLVATVMTTVNAVEGKTVLDPVALAGVVSAGIDVGVQIANLSKKIDIPAAA